MIKIFYKNKILILSKDALDNNSSTKINVSRKDNIKNFINDFLTDEKKLIYNIFGEDELLILNETEKYFIPVKAAGGLVANNDGKMLVIKRLDLWDFPKGKLEKGESATQGAIREVAEECGIDENDLKLNNLIKSTFHIYPLNNSYVLKETVWYSMDFKKNYSLKPQLEESITEIRWIDKELLPVLFKKSYVSLSDLIEFVYSK